MSELLDSLLGPGTKGYPLTAPPRRVEEIGAAGWHVLAGDLPLPLAVLKRDALMHNLAWMQSYARSQGVDLAPHGKTTMSPQLFRRQLAAGAWGLSFATVTQTSIGVAAGARRCIIANQVVSDADLSALLSLLRAHADLRVAFLVDSLAQLALIEDWARRHDEARPFEVLLEIGVSGGRTGCRTHDEAVALAAALHASRAVRLVGIECYEGLQAKGRTEEDDPYAAQLMARVTDIARHCDAQGWFADDEVIVSAGGSAIFDLVAARMRPSLSRPVRGLLRSGCYVTHDHGFYKRMVAAVDHRLCCAEGQSLQPALEVWASVQSCPEPGLAIVAVGRRDISFDLDLPVPVAYAPRGTRSAQPAPQGWKITGLNDQHAYLRWNAGEAFAPQVGDRVGLGISHPCTTFDKWHWMPIVDADYAVCDAVAMHF
jgi:D-serine dehydratase